MNKGTEATTRVELRGVHEDDLPIFFNQQLDPVANQMAAFTRKDPSDRTSFMAHWTKILSDKTVTVRTILLGGKVAGSIARFEREGEPEVTYWIGREYWGRSVATSALVQFLEQLEQCPIFARGAKDNVASIRVLEKCGFQVRAVERGFANARGQEIDELVLELRSDL